MASKKPKAVNGEAKREAFLQAVALGLDLRRSCHVAGVAESAARVWRKDPAFRERFEAARANGVAELVAHARSKAVSGSDTMLIFLLKNIAPDLFCDRTRVAKLERKWRRLDADTGADANSTPAEAVVELLARIAGAKAEGAAAAPK